MNREHYTTRGEGGSDTHTEFPVWGNILKGDVAGNGVEQGTRREERKKKWIEIQHCKRRIIRPCTSEHRGGWERRQFNPCDLRKNYTYFFPLYRIKYFDQRHHRWGGGRYRVHIFLQLPFFLFKLPSIVVIL